MRPVPRGRSGSELVSLPRTHREGTSRQRSGGAWCPPPCTPHPSHRRRAFRGCDSARWFGRSLLENHHWRRMLGCAHGQVNAGVLRAFAVPNETKPAMMITAVFGSLNYCSFAYSASASFGTGMSRSASPAEENFGAGSSFAIAASRFCVLVQRNADRSAGNPSCSRCGGRSERCHVPGMQC